MLDAKAIGQMLVSQVREFVSRAVDPLLKRIEAIEARTPERGEPGEKGLNGQAGAPGRDGVNGEQGAPGGQGEKGEAGDRGEKGDPGESGKPGDPGEPGDKGLEGAPGKDGEQGPAGLDGKDGAAGIQGKEGAAGDRGADGIAGKDGAPGIAGKDGAPGLDGNNGADGARGEDGAAGIHGKDGADGIDGRSVTLDDVRPVLEGEVAKWALEFERRAGDTLQRAIDKMPVPKDGKAGADAFALDDFEAELKDGRTLVLKLRSGDREVVRELRLDGISIYRGVYKSSTAYEEGDTVTYGGSVWYALRSTAATPGGESRDWRLAVKAGRDGRDALKEAA